MADQTGFTHSIKAKDWYFPGGGSILKALEESMEFAARAFVRTASSRIPKFTNQARGSLLNLSNRVRTNIVGGPPSKSADSGRKKPKGQSAATGRAKSYYTLTPYLFEWGTSVEYFDKWDEHEWVAVVLADEAFEETLDDEFDKRFPGY